MQYQDSQWSHGLHGERIVRATLASIGIPSFESPKYENIMQDIDCYITVGHQLASIGVPPGIYPFSIKRQDVGLKYGHFGFELEQQQTSDDQWVPRGWFNTGSAPIYGILQGDTVYILTKAEVLATVKRNGGWVKTAPLTWQRASLANPNSRYKNAICAYLHVKDVKKVTLKVAIS